MCRAVPRALCLIVVCALACSLIITARAGLRGPGKYCGVVVFDRWDTCFLLSGPYITYIPETVKGELRPYKDTAMQVDASDVVQPMNPGDALIRKFKIIGPAPDPHLWAALEGIELIAESDFGPRGAATFLIEIKNIGAGSVVFDSSELGPALLGIRRKGPFSVSDGSSEAWITRHDLWNSTSLISESSDGKSSASYAIDPTDLLPQHLVLEPGQSEKVHITFSTPPGQYQFILGYGGGVHEEKSIASNAISFDVDGRGMAVPVDPPGYSDR